MKTYLMAGYGYKQHEQINPSATMSAPFKSRPAEFNQHLLFPTNIFERLAVDHECSLYHDLFERPDTAEVEKNRSPKGLHLLSETYCIDTHLCLQPRDVQFSRNRKTLLSIAF